MKDRLASIVTGLGADYADIRYERNRLTNLVYQGRKLRQAASYGTSGGHVRVYTNGGKAISSFSDPKVAEALAKRTFSSACHAAAKRDKKLKLSSAPVIQQSFALAPKTDPRAVSLQEKQELAEHYNNIILENPLVITTTTVYDEFVSNRVFVNSEGSLIEHELMTAGIAGMIVVKKGDIVQRVRFAFGGCEDYSLMLNREEDLKKLITKACELVEAEPAKSGTFPVILDPSEAGVFIHEAFGHLSEGDGLQNNPDFRKKLQIGTVLANPILNVIDTPDLLNRPGSYEIDDEGVRGVKTQLIGEGVLTGRLHSRETAAEFNEPLSGNMRAVDSVFTPLVRMSNILIEPGESSLDDMISSIDNGYYLVGAKGGQTSGDQFTFGAQWGYRVVDGKLGPMVRDINMSGELFSTLQRISMIGDDLEFGERGGCGKGGDGPMQSNRKSGIGAPHIKIDLVTVGGI